MKLSRNHEKSEETQSSLQQDAVFAPWMPTLCIFAQLLDKFRHSCYDEKNHRAEGQKYMIWGIVTAGAALLLILVALLHAQRRRNRLEKEMVERARSHHRDRHRQLPYLRG